MNIFVLHTDPVECAKHHCDKHVVKMILEYAQLLSTAHRVLDPEEQVDPVLYKVTHKNHPCALWARECEGNYGWLYKLFYELCNEYRYRYHRVHKTDAYLSGPLEYLPINIPSGQTTYFPTCMPEEYIVEDDPVESYREYYRKGKQSILTYNRGREKPHWLK